MTWAFFQKWKKKNNIIFFARRSCYLLFRFDLIRFVVLSRVSLHTKRPVFVHNRTPAFLCVCVCCSLLCCYYFLRFDSMILNFYSKRSNQFRIISSRHDYVCRVFKNALSISMANQRSRCERASESQWVNNSERGRQRERERTNRDHYAIV